MRLVVFLILYFFRIVNSTEFHIGPSQEHQELSDIDWFNLVAGDKVFIHYREQSYREKIIIHNRGELDNRIEIIGVKSASGDLPTISGKDAVTPDQFKTHFSTEWDEFLGPVIMKRVSALDQWGYKPGFITFKNIRFSHGHPDYTYTNQEGNVLNYANGAAGMWIILGEHIVITGCEFSDNANGFFILSKSDEEEVSKDLLLEYTYFQNNGVVGRDREHQIYSQCLGEVYQYNHFGRPRLGAGGSTLKTRGFPLVVRYNYVTSAARTLDMVDPEDMNIATTPSLPEFTVPAYVYGNESILKIHILVE